ncbi:MAG: lysostaphin resistance A-like protein [Oligoflexales bacterium]
MKKKYLLVVVLSCLLSLLCREFYSQEYPFEIQWILVFTSIIYFLPIIFSLIVDKQLFDNLTISRSKVSLYIMVLLSPYLLAFLISDKATASPGINIGFIGLWAAFALCAQLFNKIRDWLILALILSIWFAFELDLFVLWNGSLYFLNVLLGIDLVIIIFPLFLNFRPFVIQFKISHLRTKYLHYYGGIFLILAIPYGLLSGFLELKSSIDIMQIPIQFLAIFFFNALPEEILFRGLLQQQAQRYMHEHLALFLVSIAFGFAHLNNYPMWDYRFVIVSFVAGICFGVVYLRTRAIAPAALLHTIINTTNAIVFDKVPLI